MDEILPLMLSFPLQPPLPQPLSDKEYDTQVQAFVVELRKTPLKAIIEHSETILDMLNPCENTIPYALSLLAQIRKFLASKRGTNNDKQVVIASSLWQKTCHFTTKFDPIQARYVGQEMREIVAFLEPCARFLGQLGAAVGHIAEFILRLDSEASTLSSQHLLLCQIALASGSFFEAERVLERDVLYVPSPKPSQTKVPRCSQALCSRQYITTASGLTAAFTTSGVQEYLLLAASVSIGLEKWQRAAELLENVTSYPTKSNTVSKPMVAAYKKWLIVKLLQEGKIPKPPGMIGQKTAETLRTMARPYELVCDLFESGTAVRLHAEISAGMNFWQEDGNHGLMKTLVESHQEHQIRGLSTVYKTVPISQVTQSTSNAQTGYTPDDNDTINLVLNMAANKQLSGDLVSDYGSTFLRFTGTRNDGSEGNVEIELAEALKRIKDLTEVVKATGRLITVDKDYMKWMQKQKTANGTLAGFNVDTGNWAAQEDEDLMARD